MSALKDFLVPGGGIIATRDESSYQKAAFASFFGGDQAPSVTMEMMAVALQEITASDGYIASRVEQVHCLSNSIKDSVPVFAAARWPRGFSRRKELHA